MAYYIPAKTKVRASGDKPMSFVRQRCALSPALLNNFVEWILHQAMQDYPWVHVVTNVPVSDIAPEQQLQEDARHA